VGAAVLPSSAKWSYSAAWSRMILEPEIAMILNFSACWLAYDVVGDTTISSPIHVVRGGESVLLGRCRNAARVACR